MTVPALADAAAALAKAVASGAGERAASGADERATGARVRVAGPVASAAADALRALGLAPVDDAAGEIAAAFAPNAQAAGALVPFLEDLAAGLPAGAPAVVADLMWTTAPTAGLLAAFPGTRPMEGYEMQVEHAGFEVVERIDAPRAALEDAWPEKRAALAEDARGAAVWRILVLRRTAD